jgi:sugar transferase (PEP-CTERM/EpsH1 system associated)
MENGLVNLINATPSGRFRHAVVCLNGFSHFAERLPADVPVYALGKPSGKSPGTYVRLWRLLRSLRPDIVHTRNLAALEGQLPASLAGVPHRIHGEHGLDLWDLNGGSRKYLWLRRAYRPLVHRFTAVSRELERYLEEKVGVPSEKVTRITNGVDTARFRPEGGREVLPPGFAREPEAFVVGWAGRMEGVKDPLALVRAFLRLPRVDPDSGRRPYLVMVGTGSLMPEVREAVKDGGAGDRVWLAGPRPDIPEVMRSLDLFALPSLAEGISNTVLEAMASGLPVVATATGGNNELVQPGKTGTLVPPGDAAALADALWEYLGDPGALRTQAGAARRQAVADHRLETMVEHYLGLYDDALQRPGEDASRLPEEAL